MLLKLEIRRAGMHFTESMVEMNNARIPKGLS